jgi:hypothetical protein
VVAAQSADTAPVDTSNRELRRECRAAVEGVREGRRVEGDPTAYFVLRSCGPDAAGAIADALLNLRTSADSALLRQLTLPVSDLRDARIFRASMQVARDPAASDAARSFALRNLAWYVQAYADLESFNPWQGLGVGCMGVAFGREPIEHRPLPADYRDRIRALALGLFRDRENAPSAVRNAAYCVLRRGGWATGVSRG